MRSGTLARLSALILAGVPVTAAAEPTDLVIRVISEGGKFVGTSMGGAEIIVRDVRSGEVLAHGRTAGSTGDTARIMTGGPRGTPLADEASAAFDEEGFESLVQVAVRMLDNVLDISVWPLPEQQEEARRKRRV